MTAGRRRAGWALAFTAVGLAFGLGWWVGRSDGGAAPSPTSVASQPPPDGGLRPEDVELRLDAGGLTLLPEGGLELPPIQPLGGASGAPDPAPAQSP